MDAENRCQAQHGRVVHQELLDQEGRPCQRVCTSWRSAAQGSKRGSQRKPPAFRAHVSQRNLKSSPQEALAWVTDLKSGQPVEGATVRFTDGAAFDLSAASDRDGIAKVTLPVNRRSWIRWWPLPTPTQEASGCLQ